jgi:23S rRNA pseudouridine1911/1915/1917 synthase
MEMEGTTITFEVDDAQIGERLDLVIVELLADLSRAHVQRLIKDGLVTVDGQPSKPAYRLEGSEQVTVRVPPPPPSDVVPQDIPLAVLYEDAHLAAIDKPAGMVVHPAYGNRDGTLVNAILARWPQVAEVVAGDAPGSADRAGIVHRLDKDTSGVILVAKTEPARLALMKQFEGRTVQKHYIALVDGHPSTAEGRIDAPIGRDPKNRKRMAVVRGGRESVTVYRVLTWYAEHTLVRAEPKTGRTHQIRVHMSFVKCPIVGDTIYGRRKPSVPIKRHFLHAAGIAFTHPATGEPLTVEAPLPPALQHVLDRLPM